MTATGPARVLLLAALALLLVGGRRARRPTACRSAAGQHEVDVLVVGVEQQQERVVGDPLAAVRRRVGSCVAVEEHAEHVRVARAPSRRRSSRRPSGRNHQTSGSPMPRRARRRGSRARRNDRVLAAQRDQPRARSRACLAGRRRAPSRTSEISLSWHQALLLPRCVRPISSPPSSIGTPCERNSVARKLRCWRARSVDASRGRRSRPRRRSSTSGCRRCRRGCPRVGLVVLLVVGDEVAQREAVVGGDEVDRGVRAAAVGLRTGRSSR